MAKNNEPSPAEKALGCLGILVVAAVIISAVLLPVVLLIWSIVSWVSYKKSVPVIVARNFWITDDEKESLRKMARGLAEANRRIEAVNSEVAATGIHINQNGRISARSYRGQALQGELDNMNGYKEETLPKYNSLREKPVRFYKEVRKYFTNAIGAGIGFLAGLIYVLADFQTIKEAFSFSGGWEMLFVESLKVLLVMLVPFFVAKLVGLIIFAAKYEKPPVIDVNLANIDKFPVRCKKAASNAEKAIPADAPEEKPGQANEPEEQVTSDMSMENALFVEWGKLLAQEGYSLGGNWKEWEHSGQWKNLSVEQSLMDFKIRSTIEYDIKSKKLYFGIAKFDEADKISQTLLKSDALKEIADSCALTLKPTEWWYGLRYTSFDNVYGQYRNMIDLIGAKSGR